MGVNAVIFTDYSARGFIRYSGAYTIASVLREHGYTVQVIDYFLLAGPDRVNAAIDKYVGSETLFVGFSTTFMNLFSDYIEESKVNDSMYNFHNIVKVGYGASSVPGFAFGVPLSDIDMDALKRRIQNLNPKTKLVMGGGKAEFHKQKQMDAFILGYADNSIIQYVRFLEGKNPFFQYTDLGNNQISVDKDIDATGYDFVHAATRYHESDMIRPGELLPIEISRGCIFKCKFCAFRMIGRKKNDYTKTTDTLYAEMMYNYEKFGTTKYSFADDTYNESVQKITDLAEMFRRLPFKIEFVAYLRHDLIHRYPEMADILKESGLKTAVFGIETLNHESGKIIGKGLHPEKTREMLQWLRDDKKWKNDIITHSGFIIGLPKDSRDSANKWIEELMDFKYPLDTFTINSLNLRPTATRLSKSEFELNYKDYGYYFDPSKSASWINEYWQFEDAHMLAESMQSYADHMGRTKLRAWQPMTMRNYGYDWEYINHVSSSAFNKDIFYKTVEWADDYYKKILSA